MASIEELIEEFKAFDVAGDKGLALLTGRKNDLARVKHRSPEQWELLRGHFKAKGVPRLSQLEKYIDEAIKAGRKASAKARAPDKDGFIRRDGIILANAANVRTAIEKMGVKLSYDTFKGWACVSGMGDGYGPNIDDNALNRLRFGIEEEFGFFPPSTDFRNMVLDAAYQNRFHPVVDYLDSLEWDGVPRIDTWLRDFAHAKDTPFVRAVSAIVLIAAVRRVRYPGTEFQELLILESEQGHGKSEMINELAVNQDWFSDSVRLNVDDKQMIESASGIWIAEYAELQGMRKGDVEKIKAQLSRRADRARMAYAHFPTVVPRQTVGFGTVNGGKNDKYLADVTGNRRFWPVEVSRCDVPGVRSIRDQLWAEASVREAAGESIKLPEALWGEAAEEQSARAVTNPFTEKIGRLLRGKEGVVFAQDLWDMLNIPVERQQINGRAFGMAMKALGWTKHNLRRDGDQETAYSKGPRGADGRRIKVMRDSWEGEWRVGYED